jgi:hypothetical protein
MLRSNLRAVACFAFSVLVTAPAFSQGQAAQGPQCSKARLIGTWERISLEAKFRRLQPVEVTSNSGSRQ